MLLRLAALSAWGWIVVACKSVDPYASVYVDEDVSPPEQLTSGIYVVECSDGSQGYFTEQELRAESASERSCKQENLLIALEDTTLEADEAGQKQSCWVPARTILRLSKPLQVPSSTTSKDCKLGKAGEKPPLEACSAFYAQLAPGEKQKLKTTSDRERDASPCKLTSGRLSGGLVTIEDIEELRLRNEDTGLETPLEDIRAHTTEGDSTSEPSQKRGRPAPRLVYVSGTLGYPKSAQSAQASLRP